MTQTTGWIERRVQTCADILLNHRRGWLALFMLLTLGLGYSATHVRLDPGFNKQIRCAMTTC